MPLLLHQVAAYPGCRLRDHLAPALDRGLRHAVARALRAHREALALEEPLSRDGFPNQGERSFSRCVTSPAARGAGRYRLPQEGELKPLYALSVIWVSFPPPTLIVASQDSSSGSL